MQALCLVLEAPGLPQWQGTGALSLPSGCREDCAHCHMCPKDELKNRLLGVANPRFEDVLSPKNGDFRKDLKDKSG